MAVLGLLLLSGCAQIPAAGHPASPGLANPPGTDVGTSNPGVNQPTDTTTASRANAFPR